MIGRSTTALLLTLAAIETPQAADLTVRLEGLRGDSGRVIVCVWQQARGFPDCGRSEPLVRRDLTAAEARSPVRFRDLPSGPIAVSVLHDENGNGTLDTNLLGIPREGVGISGNAAPAMGPPRFEQASFTFRGNGSVTIRLVYP